MIHHNSNEGIAYEASAAGRFRNCLIGFNNTSRRRAPVVWSADLMLQNSHDCVVEGCTIVADRGCALSVAHHTRNPDSDPPQQWGYYTGPFDGMRNRIAGNTFVLLGRRRRPRARRQRAAGRARGPRRATSGGRTAGWPVRAPGSNTSGSTTCGATRSARSRSTPTSRPSYHPSCEPDVPVEPHLAGPPHAPAEGQRCAADARQRTATASHHAGLNQGRQPSKRTGSPGSGEKRKGKTKQPEADRHGEAVAGVSVVSVMQHLPHHMLRAVLG